MARLYKSQLEMIRQKALADGCTHAIFWEKWSATMTSVLQDNPTMSSDSQIYKAEKTFFEKHWNEPFMGQDPSLAYVKQTRNMWFKARKDKIPIQKWEACWIEGRSISFGNVSREAEQYLLERWVWRKLWSNNSHFPGADPRKPTTTTTPLGKTKTCTPANKDKAFTASSVTKKQEPKKQEPARIQRPEIDLYRSGPRPVLAKAPETVFAPSLDIRTAESSGSQVVKINNTNNPASQPDTLEPNRATCLSADAPAGSRSTTRPPAFPSQTTKSEINSPSKVNEKALTTIPSQLLSKEKFADSQVKTEENTQEISLRDEVGEIIDYLMADVWPPPTHKRALSPSMDDGGGAGVLGNKKRVKREEGE